ncbi:hypothetical protein N0V93_008178 [Gnomoniopsis smithogilvyi]|uniref:Deacetylase sirtuin-type domain-containing protein n=1 Tax=Gnomoniopsis smithogilvyi TaxID=1191159 RepID=A0A9W8YMG1_9PEZI|nr:hypothetical protein N0V93_008178 [Gnomoniopsis smithogilvyi]
MNPDLKTELLAAANASLRRHFARLDDEVQAKAATFPPPSEEMLADFTAHLHKSQRILGLFGAGLSASSGNPTYRGANGYWRTYSDQQLATLGAFKSDPNLVWQFYEDRRRMVLEAKPNAAHSALARLAEAVPGFLTVNQNVDELCKRSGHPAEQIINFHGSLFRVRCLDDACGFVAENWDTPIVPALAKEQSSSAPEPGARMEAITVKDIPVDDLPHCPKCKDNLLRPDVIWFGEGIPEERAKRVEEWLDEGDGKVGLMLVVGTSAMVHPAATYISKARARGARVAWFNMEVKTAGTARPEEGDWSFVGDAAALVPLALESFLKSYTPA